MKEIKYIIHAFLLLLAFIGFFICLQAVYSPKEAQPTMVLQNANKTSADSSSGGKELFQSKCGSCHSLYVPVVGPALCGVESRGPWSDRKNIYQWVGNPMEFMRNNEYTRDLKQAYGGAMMVAFPDLSKEAIDEIINYINSNCQRSLAAN